MNNNDIKKAYDKVAEHFKLTRQKQLQEELFEFSRYFQDGQQILDLGCGSGRMIRIFKDFAINLFALDISKNQLNYAKKEEIGKIKNIEFIEEDILNSNFDKESFDVIVCIASFHHIKTRKQRIDLLKKMNLWLKPNGILLMTNWNLWQRKYVKYFFGAGSLLKMIKFKKAYNDCLVPYRDNLGKLMADRYYHAFRLKELSNLFDKTNFETQILEFSKNKRNIISVCKKK